MRCWWSTPSQGVEAQTVANCYTAIEQDVEVIPVLNKIDLPAADPEKAIQEIEDVIGIDAKDAIRASAKTGEGVRDILECVIARVPPPVGDPAARLRALIIDSWFDNYIGVVMLVRIFDGTLRAKERILLMSTEDDYVCEQIGVFTPKSEARDVLAAGEVGFVVAGIKELRAAKVGDTISHAERPAESPLPGFKEIKPQVFAGLYPVEANQYEALREALEKLHLNDASFHYEPEVVAGPRLRLPLRLSRPAAHGHRAGAARTRVRHVARDDRAFGGLRGRAARRFGGAGLESGRACPMRARSTEIREPIIATTIFVPQDYVGAVMTLCTQRRGVQTNLHYSSRHVMLSYDLPLSEVVLDFFDRLKSMTRGYRLAGLRVQVLPARPTWSSSRF